MKITVILLVLSLFLAGCQQVRELSLAEDEMGVPAWQTAVYEKVYLLEGSDSEGEKELSVAVFDLPGDGYTLVPGGEEEWREVVSQDEQSALLASGPEGGPRQLSLRPCLSCSPQMVGLIFGGTPLAYNFMAGDQMVTFQKAGLIHKKQE